MKTDTLYRYPTALTIAGSDSGGGAGIQADIKTFSALGVYGASVITSITAQNTQGVRGIQAISPEVLKGQLDAVFEDITIDAVKIGMLHNKNGGRNRRKCNRYLFTVAYYPGPGDDFDQR